MCYSMESQTKVTDDIARHVWDGKLNGEIAGFDEFCAVLGEISDSLQAAL